MPRKKIILACPPFRGHLHPILGIAKRLMEVADVTVVSTSKGVRIAAEAEVPAYEIMAGDEERILAISDPGHTVKNNPIRLYRQFKANVGLMTRLKEEVSSLYVQSKPDLVIADFTIPVAGLAAREQHIPWWTTLPAPCVFETSDGPPAYFGGQTPAEHVFHRLQHAAMRRAIRSFKHAIWLVFREALRELGFEGVYRLDGSEAVYSSEKTLALGIKELEFPASYPEQFHFVGPVFYTPPYKGPEPVFADDGRPHILITLGTHVPHKKANVASMIEGISQRQPGIVFHFAHGDPSSKRLVRRDNLYQYPYVSYSKHLPKYDLVVHHGGAGVMNHCLMHARPAVVYPQDFDQFDFAARLVAAGVAIEVRRLHDLEDAILKALDSPSLALNCQEMSQVYKRYDAEDTICEMVN